METEGRQAEQKGVGAARRARRLQPRHPWGQLQFLALDGRLRIHVREGMQGNPQLEQATPLLAAALEVMLRGQQLDMLAALAGAALPQQPSCGAS